MENQSWISFKIRYWLDYKQALCPNAQVVQSACLRLFACFLRYTCALCRVCKHSSYTYICMCNIYIYICMFLYACYLYRQTQFPRLPDVKPTPPGLSKIPAAEVARSGALRFRFSAGALGDPWETVERPVAWIYASRFSGRVLSIGLLTSACF